MSNMAFDLDESTTFEAYLGQLSAFFQRTEQRLHDLELQTKSSTKDFTATQLAEQQAIFTDQILPYVSWHMKYYASQSPDQRKIDGRVFRAAMKPYLDQAPIAARCLARPRGYPGDSEMMRMIYDLAWEGESLLGKLLHFYVLDAPFGKAVRYRRKLVGSEVASIASQHLSKRRDQKLNIMSVACGPASEVADIIAANVGNLNFTLLDQDPVAISEARAAVSAAQRSCNSKCSVRFVQQSIGVFLKPKMFENVRTELGEYDLIYSLGLYDYLDSKTAKRLTTSLLTLLRPGGILLLGNFMDTPWLFILDTWANWPLILRTQEDLTKIVEPSLASHVQVHAEPSGCQLFLRATRGGASTLDIDAPEPARL